MHGHVLNQPSKCEKAQKHYFWGGAAVNCLFSETNYPFLIKFPFLFPFSGKCKYALMV